MLPRGWRARSGPSSRSGPGLCSGPAPVNIRQPRRDGLSIPFSRCTVHEAVPRLRPARRGAAGSGSTAGQRRGTARIALWQLGYSPTWESWGAKSETSSPGKIKTTTKTTTKKNHRVYFEIYRGNRAVTQTLSALLLCVYIFIPLFYLYIHTYTSTRCRCYILLKYIILNVYIFYTSPLDFQNAGAQ